MNNLDFEQFQYVRKELLKYRGFKVQDYIVKKANKINDFFRENHLDSCVVGISGGVDSAVVYKLLKIASQEFRSPIKRVDGLIMPIYCNGTTGQIEATNLARFVVDEEIVYDLTEACKCYIKQFGRHLDNWTIGQIASIVRTPMLYGHAANLQSQGYRSIVVGTTNRDEGSYIGFYGKASDAMVDLQPIADIHKTEVYEVAKQLLVPNEIINRKPTGDVYDGSLDEDTIGAPYWFIQLYLLMKECSDINFLEYFNTEEKSLYYKYADNIEAMHNKNKHKYQVGLPSHFIDIMPRAIPGGWK